MLERALGGGGFDLLLTDLKMPDLDGLEIVKLCKEKLPQAVVYLVTVGVMLWRPQGLFERQGAR